MSHKHTEPFLAAPFGLIDADCFVCFVYIKMIMHTVYLFFDKKKTNHVAKEFFSRVSVLLQNN